MFSPMGRPILPRGAFFRGLYSSSRFSLYAYALGSLVLSFLPRGLSQRLPEMYLALPENRFTVSLQLLVQSLHWAAFAVWVNLASSNAFKMEDSVLFRDFAYKAAPNAPMRPAMGGLVTSFSVSISKLRKIASLRKVPPCTTILSPSSSGEETRITLYNAFFTMLTARPAEISEISAPSFCACLMEEFIKTVHLDPRSTGCSAKSPSFANSSIGYPSAWE